MAEEEIELEHAGILQDVGPPEPSFGFSLVHDRVFVTWFDHTVPDGDESSWNWQAEPRSIELSPEEAKDFHDLLNHQNDQMQALLQGFVENRAEKWPNTSKTPPSSADE